MRILRRNIPFLVAILFVACDEPRDIVTSRLRKVNVTELLADAARMHTQFFTKTSRDYFPLAPEQWPESAKKLRPLRVSLYRDGLAIALGEEPGFEFGLHLVSKGLPEPPSATPFTQYERIENGVYRYKLQR